MSVGIHALHLLRTVLSMNKPIVQDCLPLVDIIEKILVSTTLFLSQGGKLQMVNSVLSSLTTFYLCSIKVPITIIKQVEKYRRHCLWRGVDINAKKPPLVSWKNCNKAKTKGCLGVINSRMQNEVLLLKNLHKFYNKEDLPWMNLIWTNYYRNGQIPSQVKKGVILVEYNEMLRYL
jgi:hypothetical protein